MQKTPGETEWFKLKNKKVFMSAIERKSKLKTLKVSLYLCRFLRRMGELSSVEQ